MSNSRVSRVLICIYYHSIIITDGAIQGHEYLVIDFFKFPSYLLFVAFDASLAELYLITHC